jgi:hypothetical protein
MISNFVKERNEALFSLDEQKIREYAKKYGVPLPSNAEVFWRGVYKAICNINDAPADLKAKSRKWLYAHGSKPEIGG